MPTATTRPMLSSSRLQSVIDDLDRDTGGSTLVVVAEERTGVRVLYSGGRDMVRAGAAAALIAMRQQALPGSQTCPGCADHLAQAEAALRALHVDEQLWGGAAPDQRHVH